MKKRKLKIEQLKVQSFVTNIDGDQMNMVGGTDSGLCTEDFNTDNQEACRFVTCPSLFWTFDMDGHDCGANTLPNQ